MGDIVTLIPGGGKSSGGEGSVIQLSWFARPDSAVVRTRANAKFLACVATWGLPIKVREVGGQTLYIARDEDVWRVMSMFETRPREIELSQLRIERPRRRIRYWIYSTRGDSASIFCGQGPDVFIWYYQEVEKGRDILISLAIPGLPKALVKDLSALSPIFPQTAS